VEAVIREAFMLTGAPQLSCAATCVPCRQLAAVNLCWRGLQMLAWRQLYARRSPSQVRRDCAAI
jgi:hypothetical protein